MNTQHAAVDVLMAALKAQAATNILLKKDAANIEAAVLAWDAAVSKPGEIVGHGRSIDAAEGLHSAKASAEADRRKEEACREKWAKDLDKPQKLALQNRIALTRKMLKAGLIHQKTLLEAATAGFKVGAPPPSAWKPVEESCYHRAFQGSYVYVECAPVDKGTNNEGWWLL